MYSSRNTDYLQMLINVDKRILKSSEIAAIWMISDKNKLHTYLKRYTQSKKLFRLGKGIYSVLPPNKLHSYEIGCSLSGDLAYVSLETVLFNQGKINQAVYKITLVGKKNKEFSFQGQDYICYYAPAHKLVNRQGILETNGYSIANLERAINDMKELKPHYFIDTL